MVSKHRQLMKGDAKILDKLQKEHALVLIGKTDVLVKGMDRLAHVSPPHTTFKVSRKTFVRYCRQTLKEVDATIQMMKSNGRDTSRVDTFRKKLNLLLSRVQDFEDLLEHILPSRKFLGFLSKAIQGRLQTQLNLRSALKTVLARSIVRTPKPLLRQMTISNCITPPFSASTRKTLPIEMLMGPNYVIRRGNSSQITADFQKQGYSTFNARSATGWIPMRVIATKKIGEEIARGAEVASVRVNPPRGPSGKVTFDIALRSENFKPSTKFTKGVRKRGKGAKALGIDPNRPGRHVFVIGSENKAPVRNVQLAVNLSETIVKLRDLVMPRVARARNKYEKKGDRRMAYKMRKELGLLHDRVKRLKKELDRTCGRELAIAILTHDPKVVGFESTVQGLSTRGTSGNLAKAITHMPKRLGPILEYAQEIVEARGTQVKMVPVHPRITRHVGCGGYLQKTTNWDELACDSCNMIVGRHTNAAMTYANRALSAYQGSLQTSPTGGIKFGQH
ncbi:MAG: hypothetical protein P1Q69_03805 [Candidatus Thorarchaeota archaeon]|nr:hypothetical protein [Candidatus Thorarchaeota archaeon]